MVTTRTTQKMRRSDDRTRKKQSAEALTDEDSEDEYGAVEPSNAARAGRRGVMPTVPRAERLDARPATAAETAADSDSSDDRPLGHSSMIQKALQKALCARKSASVTLIWRPTPWKAKAAHPRLHRRAVIPVAPFSNQAKVPAVDAVMNPNELSQALNKVNSVASERRLQCCRYAPIADRCTSQKAGVLRLLSRDPNRYERLRRKIMLTGMRARTPSEAALRAKAMAQGPSPISPTLASVSKMPELPSNAMATVVAAQKAMALAQANPTPAAMAQAQALATSATAALNAATAHVRRGGPSPVTATFNHGPSAGQTTTSQRMPDGVELPSAARRHPEVRGSNSTRRLFCR